MTKSETVQARIHRNLAEFILRVRGENMRLGKDVSTRQITRKIAKNLNIKDYIMK